MLASSALPALSGSAWLGLIGIALLGGLGSGIRLMLSHWHGRLPWGILVGNSAASVVVGYAFVLSQHGNGWDPLWAGLLATGFAGGLSTFSSWAAQTVHFFSQGHKRAGMANLLLNLVIPVACALLGIFLGAFLLK
jgi:CrcB protein